VDFFNHFNHFIGKSIFKANSKNAVLDYFYKKLLEVAMMIEFKNVSKNYLTKENEYPVLNNISLRIEKGEYVLITGKSGSGKSTLLNILTGVDTLTTGEVTVDSARITSFNEAEMTRWRGEHIGIVFQFFQLIPTLSVLENLLLPMDLMNKIPKEERITRAKALLEIVGLSLHAKKLPTALSGGQQQRVAIARSLANDVDMIIADEPTGNLDSKNAELVFDLLEKLNKSGKTIIMVTHEREPVKGASRKIVIKDGMINENYLLEGGANHG